MHPNRGGKWGSISHGTHEPPWEGPGAPDGAWSQITSSPTLTSLCRPCVPSNYSGTIHVESQLSKFFVSMTIAPTSLLKTPNQFFLYSILPSPHMLHRASEMPAPHSTVCPPPRASSVRSPTRGCPCPSHHQCMGPAGLTKQHPPPPQTLLGPSSAVTPTPPPAL